MKYPTHKSRYFVFANLIFPAAHKTNAAFGAEYLHELMMNQPTAFARETIWLGWDEYDIARASRNGDDYSTYDPKEIIDPYGEAIIISEFALHNELPLIYGWALSTLDQPLRERLRTALTAWGYSSQEN